METIDLTTQPPRSPYQKMEGLYMMPRTIDKLRAKLPGGKIGAYSVTTAFGPGLSLMLLDDIGVTEKCLLEIVQKVSVEHEIARRARALGHQYDRKRGNRRFATGLRSCPGTASDLPAPGQAGSQRPPVRPDGCIARGKPGDFCPDHRASVLPRCFIGLDIGTAQEFRKPFFELVNQLWI